MMQQGVKSLHVRLCGSGVLLLQQAMCRLRNRLVIYMMNTVLLPSHQVDVDVRRQGRSLQNNFKKSDCR
jgi:hypothetical protein